MKLKDNALEIARGLGTTPGETYRHAELYWKHLLEYEENDWTALDYLLKKYPSKKKCYLTKEYLDKAYNRLDFEPSTFLYQVKQHLKYRKQDTTREKIEYEVDLAFSSVKKCSDIIEKVFEPIIELNKLRAKYNSLETQVNNLSKEVEKIIEETESDEDFQSLIN